ncbi:MAG: hypothetical protein FJX57_18790, partial [Alphaproteobacteria bacterium]|nr:hypothetical protein [Alphaproteobacteria bacterium]
MIRLDRVELLHWDVQPHQVLPLAWGITLLTGENGSGKTSVLDGIKIALGVGRLGGDRDVQKYLTKQARAVAMVRVVADNRAFPGTRQRPFDRLGEFSSDLVTLAVVFRAQDEAGYKAEHYLLDGDVVPPLDGKRRGVEPLPGASDYRQRLAKVGLTERYLKLLSLPQGQIASLCKREPSSLFDDLYDIIGGRQTLEAWEERLRELRKAQEQHDAIDKDLGGARIQLQALEARARRHEDWKRADSRRRAVDAALPHVELREAKARVDRLREQISQLSTEVGQFLAARRAANDAARVARDAIAEKSARRVDLKKTITQLRAERDGVFKRRADAEARLDRLEETRRRGESIAWSDVDR